MTRGIRKTAVLALCVLLAACSGGGGGDSSGAAGEGETAAAAGEGEPITLTVWTFGDFGYHYDGDNPPQRNLFAEYEEANPNITIEYQEAEYAAHHDALTTALASGSGAPDVAAVEVGFIGAFKDQAQQFVNLNDYVSDETRERYLDWKWEQATTLDGSATIGLPTDVGGMAICYRRDLFEQAGLPTDREEVSALWADSWDDYIATGQRYTEATGKAFVDNASTMIYGAVLGQNPVTYYDDEGNPIFAESEQVNRAWDVATSAIEAGIDAEIEAFSAEWNAGMANGDFAVLTCPAWMMGYIQEQAPDTEGQWDIADLPEGGGNWGGSFLTVPAQTEHPEEAVAFIEWLLAPEQQMAVFEQTGNFPSIPALYQEQPVQEFSNPFFNDAPVGPIYAENAEEVVAENLGPDWSTIDTAFENGLERVAAGQQSADESFQQTVQELEREVGD